MPEECDWGTTKLHRLGDSAGAKTLPFGFATWDPGFTTQHFTLQLDNEKIELTIFTIFKNSSGRANYRAQYTFQRAEGKEAVIPSEQ